MISNLGMGADDDPDAVDYLDSLLAGHLPGDHEREAALSAIEAVGAGWRRPARALDLSDVRWRPDLTRSGAALHLSLTGELPHVWLERLRAAHAAGRQITVAFAAAPDDVATLADLQNLDARILTVMSAGDDRLDVEAYRSIADWIAGAHIRLAPKDLRRLGQGRLDAALAETATSRGRMFEEVLCLLFSQVSWLTVDAHSYNNASEEIDIVLGVRALGHLAALARGPVAVATAKNESKATSSATVKYLKEQMANRKGRCRLGFLCSATRVSEEARIEILRGSQGSEQLIVVIEQADLRRMLANAERLDHEIERLLHHAVAD